MVKDNKLKNPWRKYGSVCFESTITFSDNETASMSYLDRINELKARLEAMGSPARLNIPFVEGRPPTQAYSEFMTNKEQGDWAERTFLENFNHFQDDLWTVRYGRSEDLVAGEPGFDTYYRLYQSELQEIGKRPDLLVFPRRAFLQVHGERIDISTIPRTELDVLVPMAVAAIEVRSSAFLSARYDAFAEESRARTKCDLQECARRLLLEFRAELDGTGSWIGYLERLVADGIDPAADVPRAMGRKSTARLAEASALTKQITGGLRTLSQRDFLSLTPKAEDLTLVYRWIQKFNVPHHYCQVFFDRAVMLSFEGILGILADPDRENRDYRIESDEKNQGKVTFKINVRLGRQVLANVAIPEHASAMKELPRGRLLFYVQFKSSRATLEANGMFGDE